MIVKINGISIILDDDIVKEYSQVAGEAVSQSTIDFLTFAGNVKASNADEAKTKIQNEMKKYIKTFRELC